MKLKYYIMAAMITLVELTGCSPDPGSVTMHKPGVYKGAKDPVLALQQQQVLMDRFKLVQTDR